MEHSAYRCPKRKGDEPRKGGTARLYAFAQQEAQDGGGNMSELSM
ncbi:hypothetical protein OROHE_010288 [Orobanche hederae]